MEKNKEVYPQQEMNLLPWKHVFGFTLCIIMTALALWGAFYTSYSPKFVLVLLAAVSFVQAALQLYHVQMKRTVS
ncbi:hypothetical protein [Halobacillus sp. Marseille-Q1614]|uniref:hypothetical protein n=1 Tax=Halobacillus sp. Marseille-Q1614 TaxID=2709134 RepID=UPI00156DE9B5|nr:hypothetical protein [Halobacillus sp. Marseille-Q1614]